MNIEHQKDLGFGLIKLRKPPLAAHIDLTYDKHYAKTDELGSFIGDRGYEYDSSLYKNGRMVDVVSEDNPTHNIEPGDWTCHQNDFDLYHRIIRACENAGFEDVNRDEIYLDEYPLIVAFSNSKKLKVTSLSKIDKDFKTYRDPEYFLTAANAQKPVKTQQQIEVEKITEYFALGPDSAPYANTLYEGGFRVSNLKEEES